MNDTARVQRFVLPCGTPVLVDHELGQRRVQCPGDADKRDGWCKGGEAWCVTAEPVETVFYTAERSA